jgi:hypothetical protein
MSQALDPLSPEALLGPANDAGGDWVDEVRANSDSWGRFELVFDEATGQYELQDLGPKTAQEKTPTLAPNVVQGPPETQILLDGVADDLALTLAGWASLAGPTGPSAFHTPFYWAGKLAEPADLRAIPVLAETCFGAAWRVRSAA